MRCMFIGAHVSISKGLFAAAKAANEIGGNTFQFFTRNPRGGRAKKLDIEDVKKAKEFMEANNFGPIVAHAPYTINLASANPSVREFGIMTLKDDMERLRIFGSPYLVVHVGSHVGQGEEKGEELIKEGLEQILAVSPPEVDLVFEAMAGEGSEMGYNFAQIGRIIKSLDNHKQIGLCIDSCHLTGAGYNLANFDDVLAEIDKEVGLIRLKVFHLNDSMYKIASRKDRHAKLGEGIMGLEIIEKMVTNPQLKNIPFILETPNELDGYAQEIKLVKSWFQKGL